MKIDPSDYQNMVRTQTFDSPNNAREYDMERGFQRGRKMFYDDPDMQLLRGLRMDLSKGYSGNELGALRQQAQQDVENQRGSYLSSLRGNLAKSGVGGARAAAIQSAADQRFAGQGADANRKIALDAAQLKRQGTGDLQDFLMRQRFGELATGMGYGQQGVADRAADAGRAAAENAAAIANKGSGSRNLLDDYGRSDLNFPNALNRAIVRHLPLPGEDSGAFVKRSDRGGLGIQIGGISF